MSRYSMHPSYVYEQKIIDNLQVKTGRNLDEWIAWLKQQKVKEPDAQRILLKEKGQLGNNQIGIIIDYAQGRGRPERYTPEAYVDAMFSGLKAHWRPLYESILDTAFKLGKDVQVCPCETIVPIYRGNVFAQLRPASGKRLELGLCLRGEPFTERLIDTGGTEKKDRITHRFNLTGPADFDSVAKKALELAYARCEK